jgi:hypothetical protein
VTYFSADFNTFGGLVLNAAPDEVGAQQAIDLLNVDFSTPGAVRSRDGFARFGVTTLAPSAGISYTKSVVGAAGDRQFVASDSSGPAVAAFTDTGTLITSFSLTGTSNAPLAFAVFGTASTAYAYGIARKNGAGAQPGVLVRWDSSAFSAAVSADFGTILSPQAVGVQRQDNRMVTAGGDDGATVYFSKKGDAETWTGTDTGNVTLDPHNGELIRGICAWGTDLFVFKESTFYRFYGNSLAADGVTPVFNYKPVVGKGMARWIWDGCVASPRGVYFVADDGVYLTSGGAPTKVSQALDPLFLGTTSSFYTGATLSKTPIGPGGAVTGKKMAWINGILYVSLGGGLMAVLYEQTGTWSLWSTPASVGFVTPFSGTSSTFDRLIIGDMTNSVLGKYTPGQTTDNGSSITSRWCSGFYEMSYRSRSGYWVGASEKTIRETMLWGTGSVNVQLAHDYGTLDAGATLTMTPGTKPARRRFAIRGTNFAHQLASVAGGAWTVQRLAQHVRGNRPVGIETTVAP